MRRFLIGSVIGALLMYAYIYYGPEWMKWGSDWMGDAASGYRGDRRRQEADKILR